MVTSYKKLVWAIIIGYTMLSIALLTPALVLLSVKIINIDPQNYTNTFGLCSAFGTAFAIIAPPLGGALGDHTKLKFGRRKTWILSGGVIGAIGMLMMGFSKTIMPLIIGWMIVQFFYNIAGASFAGLMPDQVPEEKRASYSGIVGTAQPLGVFFGMMLSFLLSAQHMNSLWIILAVIGILGPVITCLIINDTPAETIAKEKRSVKESLLSIYPSPKKYPNFTKAILVKICVLMGYGATSYITIMLAKRLGMTGEAAGKLVSLINLGALVLTAIASVIGGVLSDKTKMQRPFIAVGGISIMIGLGFDMSASNIALVIIGSVFVSLGFGIFNSTDASLVMRVLPDPENAGKDVGLMASANNLQGVLIPILAPILLGFGSWLAFFGGLSLFVVVGIIVLYTIPEDPRYTHSK